MQQHSHNHAFVLPATCTTKVRHDKDWGLMWDQTIPTDVVVTRNRPKSCTLNGSVWKPRVAFQRFLGAAVQAWERRVSHGAPGALAGCSLGVLSKSFWGAAKVLSFKASECRVCLKDLEGRAFRRLGSCLPHTHYRRVRGKIDSSKVQHGKFVWLAHAV